MTWKSIVINSVVTGLVTLLVGVALFYFQLREPRLEYSIDQAVHFPGNKEVLAIQNVSFSNEGRKEVVGVIAWIQIPSASIKQYRVVAPKTIEYKEQLSQTGLRIEIPNLNPGEKIQVALLMSGASTTGLVTQMSVRALGITGVPAEKSEKTKVSQTLIPAVIAAYAGIFSFLLMRRQTRVALFSVSKALVRGRSLPTTNSQHQELGSIFALRGSVAEAQDYLVNRKGVAYWSESDLISAKGMATTDRAATELYRQVLIDLVTSKETINLTSKAIIHCNIARLSIFLGEANLGEQHLEKAKAIDAEVVAERTKLDTILQSISLKAIT